MQHATPITVLWGSLWHMPIPRVLRAARTHTSLTCDPDHWIDCMCPVPCGDMAGERADGRTPNRVFRLDTETWEAFGRACDAKGISRSDALRMFIKAEVAAFEREQRRVARESSTS